VRERERERDKERDTSLMFFYVKLVNIKRRSVPWQFTNYKLIFFLTPSPKDMMVGIIVYEHTSYPSNIST
jgi:hypothetical protein